MFLHPVLETFMGFCMVLPVEFVPYPLLYRCAGHTVTTVLIIQHQSRVAGVKTCVYVLSPALIRENFSQFKLSSF